jgi:hypothetical protein
VPLVRGLFQFIDHLVGAGPFTGKSMLNGLRPETRTKLKKGRELLDAELRADAERESKEAEKEAREAAIDAKRKAEKDRIAGLSASEQAKVRIQYSMSPIVWLTLTYRHWSVSVKRPCGSRVVK